MRTSNVQLPTSNIELKKPMNLLRRWTLNVEHAGFPGSILENSDFTARKSLHLGVAESADATDLKSVG
jgi:hypothetical protein